ncbi:alkaline phosphatase family protein [Pseudomonas kermanshahensis]|uniref:alkaline phosphatase family protein n=1 Tax=Pseudomonas kermanshahensis TaxID=2745482 RepID=UPI00209205B9|nr:alkaline phosphatase family protein [Pseudomonas kermanshahensis]USS56930.1 alkaline phosphatase family protein [Pseudomonas kermanshahensis]
MRLSALLLMTLVLLAACDPAQHARQPKTLIIGIEGVQLERYEALGDASNLQKRLYYGSAYTGGITGKASEQPTLSGPGWVTLLTGVWSNKHGVDSNAESLRVAPAFPSLFKRLRQALPTAYLSSVVNWSPINTAFLLEDAHGNDVRESGLSDDNVIARALQILDTTPADFTFIQLGGPDAAGHNGGFDNRYQQALRKADNQVGELLDAVELRSRRHPREDWLVIVSTDHGRDYWGKGHGGVTEQEKTIFIASNKPLNEELTQPSVPQENPGPNNLYRLPTQTSVAPTVLRHMGLTLQPQWLLDGTPLLGDAGARKARADEANARLRWHSTAKGYLTILKNGHVVAQVPAAAEQWTDPDGMDDVNDYVLLLDGTPAAVRNRPASMPYSIEEIAY